MKTTKLHILRSLALTAMLALTAPTRAETLIIPSQFENAQGSQVLGGGGNPGRIRFQILYLSSEFPQEPIEIIGMRFRPKSGTPTQTTTFRDFNLNLTTTKESILQTDFAVNFDRSLQAPALLIDRTVVLNTVRPVPDRPPRAFDYEFNWEETPFRYDPAEGKNLLMDFGNPFGFSGSSPSFDATSISNRRFIIQTSEHPDSARRGAPYYWDDRYITQFVYRRAQVPASAGADVISDWNDTTIKVIKAAGVGGPATTRPLALVHVAQFDAVNAVTGGYTPYFSGLAAPGASAEAAAAQAAYAVLKALFPTNTLPDATLAASLAAVPDNAAKTNGIALGNATAAALLAARAGDGFNASISYTAPTPGPGLWEPRTNAAIVTPQWRYVNPWTMKGSSQFRAGPPPALTSATYTADFNEIKSLGETNSVTRTADQTDSALFHVELQFYLSGYTASAALATRPLPLVQSARLFALIALAQADAAITEWDTKYFYNFWRPQTAIRNGDTDSNPDTHGDPNWTSLRPSPNHPEFAGAAAIAMTAATEVLADVFGDQFSFTIESPSLPGKPRTFARFSDLSTDAINARVYIGFHFRNSSIVGAARGRLIAQHVLRNFLLPVPSAVSGQAQASGAFQLNLLTVGARPYVIEKSSDLVSWAPWKTNLTGLVSGTEPGASSASRKFYRAVAR